MNHIDRESFRLFLTPVIEMNHLPVRRVAAAIPCSQATLGRLLAGTTLPSDEMLVQGALLIELGFQRYTKLSRSEREKLSDALGTVGGGTVGFASITAAVGAMGSVAGVSAAGISSGLAAIGSLLGGGMLVGVAVAAAMPVAAAGAGYGVVRTVKHFVTQRQLNQKSIDSRWEILRAVTVDQTIECEESVES